MEVCFILLVLFGISSCFRLNDNVTILDLQGDMADLKLMLAEQDKKIAEQKADLCSLKMEVLKQASKIVPVDPTETFSDKVIDEPVEQYRKIEKGAVFTRWGRTDCPANISKVLYSGYVGGSRYNDDGGAANYVCLPQDPTWNNNKHYLGSKGGYMYGGEYEVLPDTSLDDVSAVCAVCVTASYSLQVMIPGRSSCYDGWVEAYSGDLASGHRDHKAASEYICLDMEPEHGDKRSNDGKLLYAVYARCGALPCPPYENNKLLACVVCLK